MYSLSVLDNQKIFYYTDVVTRPDLLINFIEELDLVKESHTSISPWSEWSASNNHEVLYGKTKFVNAPLEGNDLMLNRKVLYVINSLKSAALYCATNYALNLRINDIKIENSFRISKYNEGTSMGPHTDAYDEEDALAYSILVYLNDDYEGGEIFFPNQNILLKPQAGSLIIFPSCEPYVHQVKEITKGTRYISPFLWYKS
jgi:hypothetical protein